MADHGRLYRQLRKAPIGSQRHKDVLAKIARLNRQEREKLTKERD